jgi:hypothetical protein
MRQAPGRGQKEGERREAKRQAGRVKCGAGSSLGVGEADHAAHPLRLRTPAVAPTQMRKRRAHAIA